LEDELLVILWTDILTFSLHVKLLLELFYPMWEFEPLSVLCCVILPLECLHSGLGLTLFDAFLIHMHVGIWFRQFCSVRLQPNEPTLNCFRWYPFLSLHTLSLFYSSLQALSLKNHDYSYLRKFWSFGIVLGMGAQLSVVADNKCGCPRTCYWLLGLLICIPKVGFQNCCFFACSLYRKNKKKERKQKEKKRKQRKEIKGVWIWALCENRSWKCWCLGLLSCLIETYSPLLLYFLGCLATYPYVPHLVLSPITTLKSPSDLDLHVFLVWLLV